MSFLYNTNMYDIVRCEKKKGDVKYYNITTIFVIKCMFIDYS